MTEAHAASSTDSSAGEPVPNGRRSADVETAILEAARDLLAAHGADGLSMRQVAEQVGVSATAIYHYFEGKQDLVHRVVYKAFERFGEYLRDAMDRHPEGSVDRIVSLGEAYLRFALENKAYFRVMFSMQPRDPHGLQELPEGGGYHLLRQSVADAIEAGTIVNESPDLISMYLWSSAHGLVTLALCGACERCQADGIPSSVDLYRAFMPFIANGIRVRAGAVTEGRLADHA